MIEGDELVFGVENHANRIEANRVSGRPDVLFVVQPCGGKPPQARALTSMQPRQRLLIGTNALLAGTHSARLDLGEHERVSVEDNQVDLAVTRAFVATQRGEAEPVEVGHGHILAETAQLAAHVGALSLDL
jgi:hypothetical protein